MRRLAQVLVLGSLGACGGETTAGPTDLAFRPKDAAMDAPADGQLPAQADGQLPAQADGQLPAQVGGDRPARVLLPKNHDPATTWPLVLLIHGYRSTAAFTDQMLGLSSRVSLDGFVLLLPEATLDGDGFSRWNQDPAMGAGPDDVGYLTALLRESIARYAIDPQRVYVVGHSNGGYMAYRLACEIPELITAIAPLGCSSQIGDDECGADGPPVNLLHAHGGLDLAHPYDGSGGERAIEAVVERHASQIGCGAPDADEGPFDFDTTIAGAETEIRTWSTCERGTRVMRWKLNDVGHLPFFTAAGTERYVRDLLSLVRTP